MFDIDDNGYIDVRELAHIMKRLGQELDLDQVKVRESVSVCFLLQYYYHLGIYEKLEKCSLTYL